MIMVTPPFPLARSSPGREAAKRTLDGEDRSEIIQGEGKGGAAVEGIGETGLLALVNRTARHFRNIFAAAILALRP